MENQKINKKGAGYITNTLISLLLFTAGLITMLLFYGNIVDTEQGYGYLNITTDERFEQFRNNATQSFNAMVGQSPEMQSQFTDSSTTKDSGENNMVTNSFSVVKTIFENSFTNLQNIGGVITTSLGIPKFWLVLFISIIIIVIFIAVLAGFMRATSW